MKGFGGMKFKGGGVGLGKRSGGGSISMKIGGALVSIYMYNNFTTILLKAKKVPAVIGS